METINMGYKKCKFRLRNIDYVYYPILNFDALTKWEDIHTDDRDIRDVVAEMIYYALSEDKVINIPFDAFIIIEDEQLISIILEFWNNSPFYYDLNKKDNVFINFYYSYLSWHDKQVTMAPIHLSDEIKKLSLVLEEFANSLIEIFKPTIRDNMIAGLDLFRSKLSEMYKSFSEYSYLSDEELEIQSNNIEKWADYGWTYLYWAPFDYLIQDAPDNQLEADRLVRGMIGNDNKDIFISILKFDIDKREIAETIKCFESKLYRASAMILVSLIERRLLVLQRNYNKGKNITVGKGGVDKFIFLIDKKTDKHPYVFIYLNHLSLIIFLTKLFSPTDNFKDNRCNINRNLLMHGMRKKEVRKKDCLKLFLAYHNICYLIEHHELKF